MPPSFILVYELMALNIRIRKMGRILFHKTIKLESEIIEIAKEI